jgi:hypothetical protein
LESEIKVSASDRIRLPSRGKDRIREREELRRSSNTGYSSSPVGVGNEVQKGERVREREGMALERRRERRRGERGGERRRKKRRLESR